MKITRVVGKEIYDSRGWPMLLCQVSLNDGSVFTGHAPTANARSKYEAHEIKDGKKRLWGRGMENAIELIESTVAPLLVGQIVEIPDLDFALIELDGTPDKSRLGSNVLTATSMALYKAFAYIQELELYELFAYLIGADSVTLPCPIFSIVSGSKDRTHRLAIQEFLIAPIGATTLKQAVELSVALYHELKAMLHAQGKLVGISEEGGFTVNFTDEREILDILMRSLEKASLEESGLCALGLNASATEIYDPIQQTYKLHNKEYSAQELVSLYTELTQTYPIYSIEDGLSEDDWDGWKLITETLGDKIQIAGDALFSTNPDRLERALQSNVATAAMVKLNQTGTITEVVQFINLCRAYRLNPIISYQSGETEDTFLADLAVGTSAGQFKAGGCSRMERIAKYNRLLEIEQALIQERNKL